MKCEDNLANLTAQTYETSGDVSGLVAGAQLTRVPQVLAPEATVATAACRPRSQLRLPLVHSRTLCNRQAQLIPGRNVLDNNKNSVFTSRFV